MVREIGQAPLKEALKECIENKGNGIRFSTTVKVNSWDKFVWMQSNKREEGADKPKIYCNAKFQDGKGTVTQVK